MRKRAIGGTHEVLIIQCDCILGEAGIKTVLSDELPSLLYVDRTDMVNTFRTDVSIPEAPGGAYENCKIYLEKLIGADILWNKLDDTYFVISDFIIDE
jgi:hypothetical protein